MSTWKTSYQTSLGELPVCNCQLVLKANCLVIGDHSSTFKFLETFYTVCTVKSGALNLDLLVSNRSEQCSSDL